MKRKIFAAVLAVLLSVAGCTGKKKEAGNVETKVLWTGYSDSWMLFEKCLNADRLVISSVRHLPVYLIESRNELEQFISDYYDCFGEYYGQDDIQCFRDGIQQYDDEFFADRSLVLAYVTASSGSFRYGVKNVEITEDSVCIYVVQTNNPEVYTMDMSGWMAVAEINKDDCGRNRKYDAQFAQE